MASGGFASGTSITAKAPAGAFADAQGIAGAGMILNAMLRALLVDRFKLAVPL